MYQTKTQLPPLHSILATIEKKKLGRNLISKKGERERSKRERERKTEKGGNRKREREGEHCWIKLWNDFRPQ